MQNWKATLTYDGAPFHGWQVQPGLPTVQGTLARALHRITGESVLPQGSGRTDTGVHALGQVASFALNAPIPARNLHRALNRALPASIRLLSLQPVPPHFHARHCALRKTYEYRILPTTQTRLCSPMLAPYVWDLPASLDLARLERATAHILGTHDFTSFAASRADLATRSARLDLSRPTEPGSLDNAPLEASNIRTIFEAAWTASPTPPVPNPTAPSGHSLLFSCRITGSGFLHHMVRNLVGTFVEASLGRIQPDDLPAILAAKNRSAAGPTAPARGLFLVSVVYPEGQTFAEPYPLSSDSPPKPGPTS